MIQRLEVHGEMPDGSVIDSLNRALGGMLPRVAKQPKPKCAPWNPDTCMPEPPKLADFMPPSMHDEMTPRSFDIDMAMALSLSTGECHDQQCEQKATLDGGYKRVQHHLARVVTVAYKAEAAGYLACSEGDFVILASSEPSEGDEGCMFQRYVFACRPDDQVSGWLPEDVLANV